MTISSLAFFISCIFNQWKAIVSIKSVLLLIFYWMPYFYLFLSFLSSFFFSLSLFTLAPFWFERWQDRSRDQCGMGRGCGSDG